MPRVCASDKAAQPRSGEARAGGNGEKKDAGHRGDGSASIGGGYVIRAICGVAGADAKKRRKEKMSVFRGIYVVKW